MNFSEDSTLAAAEKTFRDIFNYSSDLIYILDINGVLIDVNQTVIDQYGYRKEELIGKTVEFISSPRNDLDKIALSQRIAWEQNQTQSFEWWGLKKNGDEFLKEIVVRKGRYFDRDVIIATGRDITERKRYEEKMKERNQELKKVNAALDAFVYSASHDLKAPLSSLKGLIDLMRRDDASKTEEYIYRMEMSISKLNQLIYDLVDYSRNAKTDIQVEQIDINEKVRQVVNELKYAEEGESVFIDLQFHADQFIYSDAFRLEVILRNLISNSIRYHDRNKNRQYIIIKTSVVGKKLIIEVIDNGIGIAAEHQDKIFQMFYRANQLNRNGSGLGLFMVKEALALLKGSVKVESTLKKGTKMRVEIPLHNEQ